MYRKTAGGREGGGALEETGLENLNFTNAMMKERFDLGKAKKVFLFLREARPYHYR